MENNISLWDTVTPGYTIKMDKGHWIDRWWRRLWVTFCYIRMCDFWRIRSNLSIKEFILIIRWKRRNPHLSETSSPACEQANVSDRSDHLHTRTCFEKRVGGPTRYPWQWTLSHTDFNPTISGRDTTKLWSFPLGFFQGQLGTISWYVFGKHLWGYTRGSRFLTLLCRAHYQGRKWLHPKGNHHPQEIKRVRHSRALRGKTISAFRRSQAKAQRLFNQKKRQSWAECVSKLSAETPIKHVWDRVRKVSGKNICPPKQYLNGKNGTTITKPKDIANEHAAVFTDIFSTARYSATFQAIKEQEEKVKIDFISDNTEVYNKPFRLRDLRRSIMKAKPRAPGPDGIHNNLLKHLPQDTLKILKEILNKIWISADFPQQCRAATVIPIPKLNKDHTDPRSYRPIALTSCLRKVINTRLIWYLEKYRILDRSQCGFRKHRSTTDHLVSLERYLRDAFAQKQQAVGLFFDLEKAYETTWQYGIIRDLHRIGLRGRLPVFVSEYLRDRQIRLRIGTTLSDEFYPEEGVPTGGVLAVTCFGLKINELPSCIAKDIFKALFVDDLAICFRGRSLDTIERHLQQAVNAIQEWATRNGFRFAAHKCKVIHFTAPRSQAQRPPIVRIGNTLLPVEESMKFLGLWWDSHLSFKKHISVLKTQCKEALNLIRVVAHLKWGGDRDTLLMLYHAIVRCKFDYGCIVYGTASNTNLRQLDSVHNSGLRLALGAFCTSPVSSLYTEANEAPLEERRLKLSMHYYVKTHACIDRPVHHALHEFDRTTRDLYAPVFCNSCFNIFW